MKKSLLLGLALSCSIVLSLYFGSLDFGAIPDDLRGTILFSLRLPRTLCALLVGMALGGAGAALQGLFRNPLADPSILGVSAAAALFAQCTLYFGWALVATWSLPLAATLGAALAAFLLLRLVGNARHAGIELLILGGVAVGQIALALSALLLSLSLRDYTVAQRLLSWSLGNLDGRTWMHVFWGVGPVLVGLGWLQFRAMELDGLSLGESTAHSLGVSVTQVRRELILAASLLSGIAVAIGGIISFVGLLAPHWVRAWGSRSHRELIVQSALLGGLLVVSADLVGRVIIAPAEVQIGVLTAALGAPWFALLLRRRLKEALS